ncbi:MAG: hypothetical protein ACR2NM_04145, partial [Bythopirellula sp.]
MSRSKATVCLTVLTALVSIGQGWADELALRSSLTDSESISWDSQEVGFASSGDSPSACFSPCSCVKSCGPGAGKKAKPNPAATSHKGLFYANDFGYLNDPGYGDAFLGDALKLMPLAEGDWGTLDVGGQIRLRYHSEVGMGREGAANVPRFQDTNNDFLLSRVRL